jgi:tRNA wybutosine-synthesizing protein 1
MPLELVDEPDVIVNQLLHERRKLIVGFYGNKKSDKTKIDESLLPSHYAISLSGEPTMYPKLPYLINYLNSLKQTKSIFLVTNGQEPEMLERLQKENALPTQIYLSTNASNKIMFHKVNGPKYRDAWERWNKSLKFIADTSARTVLRITLIRNYNDKEENIKEFAELILKGNPHFIEIKSYMHIGMSTQRLERDNMLSMNEIRKFTQKLCYYMRDFKIMDESEVSRIMVIQNQKRYIDRWIKAYT